MFLAVVPLWDPQKPWGLMFFSMFLHLHPFVTKMTQGQSADVMSTTTQKASAMANFVKWTDHEMILQNSINNCYSKWGFKFAVLCWFPSSPRYMRVYMCIIHVYMYIYMYICIYVSGRNGMDVISPPQPPHPPHINNVVRVCTHPTPFINV